MNAEKQTGVLCTHHLFEELNCMNIYREQLEVFKLQYMFTF